MSAISRTSLITSSAQVSRKRASAGGGFGSLNWELLQTLGVASLGMFQISGLEGLNISLQALVLDICGMKRLFQIEDLECFIPDELVCLRKRSRGSRSEVLKQEIK